MSAWNGVYENGNGALDPETGRVLMEPCPRCDGNEPGVYDCELCDGTGEIPA